MADTFTPNYNLLKPDPTGLADISELNGDLDTIDAALFAAARGELNYAEIVANSPLTSNTGVGNMVDIAGLAFGQVLLATRKYELEFYGMVGSSDGATKAVVALIEGASTVLAYTNVTGLSSLHGPPVVIKKRIYAPSFATHNYKVGIYRVQGTGTVQVVAGSNFPAFLRVSDIGPA